MKDDIYKKHLLLVGGGHAHVMALKMLAMGGLSGVRITLISNSVLTPYSGMLPGLIAGHYQYDEVHIDLARLCRALNVCFIEDSVEALDLDRQLVICRQHPVFRYDVLSIDTGSTPDIDAISGAAEFVQPVKPVDRFLRFWLGLQARLQTQPVKETCRIALVGAGASGVEVALAMQHRLQEVAPKASVEFHIVSATSEILPSHPPKVRSRYQKILEKRAIQVHRDFRVTRVNMGCLYDESNTGNIRQLVCDEIIWAISAAAPDWPARAGLACSEKGFIKVNACLQSVSHTNVFAVGDVADVLEHPRPKAGVFAVRQGKPLAQNLLRALTGLRLKPFSPQKRFLSLVSTGDKYAVASRGGWSCAGKWVWRWKDYIDRKFIRGLNEFGKTDWHEEKMNPVEQAAMRCGGCGAKIGQPILQRVLSELPSTHNEKVQLALSSYDDAAVFSVPADSLLVQSVDMFRKFIEDDFLFGQIAANHALGDIFAMGADPHSAQALVTLPFASEENVEQQLLHLMLGASKVFEEAGIPLIGGHTAEGRELSLGFAVNGLVEADKMLTKGGLQSGDVLILTKALGTGVIFAADMRGQAQSHWIKLALDTMLKSNQQASELLFKYQVKACTDVTGFGLAGHLLEMLQASDKRAKLDLMTLPVLNGALELMQAGFFSSLHPQNKQIETALSSYLDIVPAETIPQLQEIIYDPQTAGGLLIGLPAANAKECLSVLKGMGYSKASIIGKVL